MDEALLRALLARRPEIRGQWESLLRLEKPASALAHPGALARLIDWTLDEALEALRRGRPPRPAERPPAFEQVRRACACGRNPLIEYFLAGERALIEALVLAQAEAIAPAAGRATAATEVHLVMRRIARREVALFCSVCLLQCPPGAGAQCARAAGSVSSSTARMRSFSSAGR